MLSQKCKYAIRAALYLSIESNLSKGLKSGKDVSEALKIPLAFTGKILLELSRAGIITSVKGPGGGFYLSKENLRIPVIEIVKAMGDISFFTSCGLGLHKCSDDHPCPIHNTFKIGRDSLLTLFQNKTIGELGREVKKSELFLVR
ncbi:MAG: RrF2 family transcriptional regulator [Bacteroidia bacterium]